VIGRRGERGPAGAGFSDQDPLVLMGQLVVLPARAALVITRRVLALPGRLVGSVLGR
jgi:hypothetical protein